MTARTGMANLITRLRAMTEAGTADYTLGAQAYWSDDHLQAVLDTRRRPIVRQPLRIAGEYVAGAWEYHDYYLASSDMEEDASGTAQFSIRDSLGVLHGTAEWSANYNAGQIRFAADTMGSAMVLSGYAYDLNASAADIWERKASHAHTLYDFSADGASYKRSQQFDYCLKMSAQYRGAGDSVMKTSSFVRSDANVGTGTMSGEEQGG